MPHLSSVQTFPGISAPVQGKAPLGWLAGGSAQWLDGTACLFHWYHRYHSHCWCVATTASLCSRCEYAAITTSLEQTCVRSLPCRPWTPCRDYAVKGPVAVHICQLSFGCPWDEWGRACHRGGSRALSGFCRKTWCYLIAQEKAGRLVCLKRALLQQLAHTQRWLTASCCCHVSSGRELTLTATDMTMDTSNKQKIPCLGRANVPFPVFWEPDSC